MTVSFAPSDSSSHAVVIGGSIAGLMAARVLLNHFDQVTLIERDRLPDHPELRPGVPQACHVHVLLVEGYRRMETFFPGITDDLRLSGAIPIEWTQDWPILGIPGWFPRFSSDLKGYSCSRVLLETLIRKHLIQDPRLTVLESCQVDELLMDATKTTVTGVHIQHRSSLSDDRASVSSTLKADLIVDASGRTSKLPDWLTAWGYDAPTETKINAFWGYASRWYKRPDLPVTKDWQGITLASKPGEHSRGGILYPVEGDRWIVSVSGVGKDYPPTDEAGFLDFVRSLRDPAIYNLIWDATPISPVYGYRQTENRLRHYEKLSRFPDGIVALGDAVCAFNPVYGQGMTVATMEACLLDRELKNAGSCQQRGFSASFQRKMAHLVQMPWMLATGEDSRYPTTVGSHQSWATRLVQQYVDQVVIRGLDHPFLFQTFAEVLHMVKPASALFHPAILRTVITELGRSPRNGMQSPLDPSVYHLETQEPVALDACPD